MVGQPGMAAAAAAAVEEEKIKGKIRVRLGRFGLRDASLPAAVKH